MDDTATNDPRRWFHDPAYIEINRARLDHLDFVLRSMGLKTRGLRVIELGAGVGDLSQFWLDRGCTLTITEARAANLAVLRERYPGVDVRKFDLDRDDPPTETFDIVHAYGVLYHLADPARGIASIAKLCAGTAFIELCVSFGEAMAINPTPENGDTPTQAVGGVGCRPTRPWVFAEIAKHLPFVYQPGTQPTHPQFPTDWRAPATTNASLSRSTFVGSRTPVTTPTLFPRVLNRQTIRKAPASATDDGLAQVLRTLAIGSVLDVGANVGQFGKSLRRDGYAGEIVSFEPLRHAFGSLKATAREDPSWHVRHHALGAADGEAIINVSANAVSSSFLVAERRTLEAEPMVGRVGSQKAAVHRLDSIWPDLPKASRVRPILLKIDTQGFEPEVLAGASGVIDRIDAVLIEASLVPVYRGETLLGEMLGLMQGLGFFPVWLRPGWGDAETGQVYQCDVLFSRTPDLPRPQNTPGSTDNAAASSASA